MPTDEDILVEFIDEREPEEDDNEEEDGEDEAEIKLPVTIKEAKEALQEDFQTIYKLEDECTEIPNNAKNRGRSPSTLIGFRKCSVVKCCEMFIR